MDDGSDLRNRSTRNSFKKAVDRSFEPGEEDQRGVDGECKGARSGVGRGPEGSGCEVEEGGWCYTSLRSQGRARGEVDLGWGANPEGSGCEVEDGLTARGE